MIIISAVPKTPVMKVKATVIMTVNVKIALFVDIMGMTVKIAGKSMETWQQPMQTVALHHQRHQLLLLSHHLVSAVIMIGISALPNNLVKKTRATVMMMASAKEASCAEQTIVNKFTATLQLEEQIVV